MSFRVGKFVGFLVSFVSIGSVRGPPLSALSGACHVFHSNSCVSNLHSGLLLPGSAKTP